MSRTLRILAVLTASAVLTAPTAAADEQSFYDALHAQGITSSKGDQALFNAGTQVSRTPPFTSDMAATGDFSAHAARLPKIL
ncbi:hypothetical protein [Mycolicibacterium pyrenivorans]|uniref:hypothetical protein n=1 Tax=Mycolicibacterium pyrenivorans TaxID=187102 RepID=UPI0021F2FA93|nr:hypothetical protein [Mycolicibacterium pyrenivorans]MCV7155242.1 DUF732 domain-containing protein [Mycolicibacterium pyrenivorans]